MKWATKWSEIGFFGPNFSSSHVLIVYNTANNAVNYKQTHIFIVKNSALFKKKG